MLFSGKWHVSVEESPRDKGWQELCVGGHRAGGPTWDLYRDLAAQSEPTDRRDGEILRPGYPPYRLYGAGSETSFIKQDETALGHALDALPQLAKGNDPWVLFVGVVGPHDPYIVPKEFIDLYSLDDVPLPPTFGDDMADKPRIYQRLRQQIWGQLTEREVRDAIRHYWAYCSYLDDMFGKLLRALDETGAAENTLVAYCSDHGDYCGDHGLFCKGIPCFRGAYHVPAVLRWPAGIENPGRRVDGFVSLADFAPTFIELAALEVDRDFSGASLAPFLRGDTPTDWRDEIHAQCNGVELYYTQRWVMTKQFKYVFNGFDFDELYDLHADPDEMTNLSEQSAYAEIKRDLVRRMWRFACRENDTVINDYITVGLTPYGPAEAFREGMP
jgi:arylsulfatase A-like enzyme